MSDDHVTVASNVLGTIGTVLWCIQLIPQIWYNWKRKKTDGFPATMMFLWASCMSPNRARAWAWGGLRIEYFANCLLIVGSVPMGAYLILQV